MKPKAAKNDSHEGTVKSNGTLTKNYRYATRLGARRGAANTLFVFTEYPLHYGVHHENMQLGQSIAVALSLTKINIHSRAVRLGLLLLEKNNFFRLASLNF